LPKFLLLLVAAVAVEILGAAAVAVVAALADTAQMHLLLCHQVLQ
jgi:hypothetical protein